MEGKAPTTGEMVAAEGAAETLPAAEERLTPVEAGASLEELQRERDEYYDRLLRKAAEFENYRKRTDRERREQADAAAADLLKELLPIVDNLERALQAELGGSGVDAYRRGVELIHKQLTDLLGRHGVTPIDAVGQDFDPRYHQAVIHEASDRHRNGEVMAELRRGYKLGERLLRPAMVKVAKA